jgi:hypothetical protein
MSQIVHSAMLLFVIALTTRLVLAWVERRLDRRLTDYRRQIRRKARHREVSQPHRSGPGPGPGPEPATAGSP